MLERSAGKLARSVLRGLGEREPTWLPGGVPIACGPCVSKERLSQERVGRRG
jgi:hypothetical protein